VRRVVVMLMLTAAMTAMLALSASPAMAFIHTTLPAGSCTAIENAADNENTEDMIIEHNPAKRPGLQQTGVIVDVPAPSTAPCHK
jgi:hypothetical protein